MTVGTRAVGASLQRLDGPAKVTGTAPYAYEQPVEQPLYVYPLQSTIVRGRMVSVALEDAAAVDGVVAVLTPRNATRLADVGDAELAVLQSDEVAFRGQFVGAVVAETPETARYAAGLVEIVYQELPYDTELVADGDRLYTPEKVNPAFAPDTDEGDVTDALRRAAVTLDHTYRTPMEFNNPMEPHTTVALWDADGQVRLTLYDSTQAVHGVRRVLAPLFGLEERQVRVIAPHVGGGFGSKGTAHAHDVLAVLCARAVRGRPVKLALTRQQMFSLTGHRTPTIQRIRLGADADGRLTAICHEAVEHTSTVKEFAEQTAVPTRMMYAAPHRRTAHRLAALDVPVPSWMRAPGETPGVFALEVAMDELAVSCGLDPVELRARNEPERDPESGKPWSGRRLVDCLRDGARRFGWERRTPPGSRREGRQLVGLGVAASTYPCYGMPGSQALVRHDGDGRYTVRIGAIDLGTGTWTALTQIAADALGCPPESVHLAIGDTDLPPATVAGGSAGITSWGSTIVSAARNLRATHGTDPRPGAEALGEMPEGYPDTEHYAVHSFGAQFTEVRVDADTGEIRVPRMLGVFSVGRVINPRTARSQFIGGMIMGLSMALHEVGVLDHHTGHVVNHDFAEYHIAAHADVADVDAVWFDEEDPHANPMGSRGIGEIGIVGAAASVVNAVYAATGIRVRDLPVTADKLLS